MPYTLNHLTDVNKSFCKGKRPYRRFKSRHKTNGFAIPDPCQAGTWLPARHVQGLAQSEGANLYAAHRLLTARIMQEGSRARPKWYPYIIYAVPVSAVKQGPAAGELGLVH